MTAVRKPQSAPTFVTYTEVEVEVEARDLEREGWVYVGKGDDKATDATTSAERVLSVVQDWHNEAHEGPWRWCQHKPCDDLRVRA